MTSETPVQTNDPRPIRADADGAADRARFARWLGAIVVLGFALRLAYLFQMAALPIFDQPVGDSAAHLARATAIAAGHLLPETPFYYCSIFYPYFLALVLGPLDGSLFTVGLVQIVMGVLTVAVLAIVARRGFGTLAGLATGACAALYGPFAFFEADVLGVAGGQLALALALLLCTTWWRDRGDHPRRDAFVLGLAGAALGLAVVERPNLALVTVAVAWWCVACEGIGRAWRRVLALGAGTALPVLVVLALNVAGTGQWVPLTTSAGINLSLSYHDGATGTYDEPWERESPEFSARHVEPEEAMIAWASARMGRPVSAMEASDYWRRQALDWIRSHPGETARLLGWKTALMLNAAEVTNHLNFEFIRERAWALRLMPLGFGAVLPLAVIGAAAAWRARRERALVVLLVAGAVVTLASVALFTVADRYRAPMVLPLVVLAGGGIAYLVDLVRRRAAVDARAAAAILAAGVAATLIAHVPLVHSMRGRDHWMFAEAWLAKGRLAEAIAEYEAGARAEPANGPLLNNLATAYRRAGRRAEALAVLRRLVAIEPRLAYPHKNLGMMLIGAGDHGAARAELQAAHALDSLDAEVLGALGALHAEDGDRARASEHFARALTLAPGDARLRALAAHYQFAPAGP